MSATYNPRAPGRGLTRAADGVLEWHGGRHYDTPDEAVRSYHKGVLAIRCNERIFSMWSSGVCGNTAKHDPDKNGNLTKCGRHCAEAVAKKKEKQAAEDAKRSRQWNAREALWKAEKKIEAALRSIADGHNDPRSLAKEVMEAVDAARAEKDAANA
jgi:hypothetical protein